MIKDEKKKKVKVKDLLSAGEDLRLGDLYYPYFFYYLVLLCQVKCSCLKLPFRNYSALKPVVLDFTSEGNYYTQEAR